MFDWLENLDLGDVVGDAVDSGTDWLGDLVSTGTDWLGDTLDYVTNLDFLNGNEDSLFPSTVSDSLDFPSVVEPTTENFLDTSIQSSPETIYDFSQGMDVNPVAAEQAWKTILQDPMASIAPGDYTLSSPTVLDKLLTQNSSLPLSESSQFTPAPDWFTSGQSSPWPSQDYLYSGRSEIVDPKAYEPQTDWLDKLLSRPMNGAGQVIGKSLLSKILGTALAGTQVYGALNSGKVNSNKLNQMKANIKQIPTKKMTWKTPTMARGGEVQASENDDRPPWMKRSGVYFTPPSRWAAPYLTPEMQKRGSSPQPMTPERLKQLQDRYQNQGYAQGGALGLLRAQTSGQDDVIPIAAAGGEYVFDADTVSALGDGNTEAGARKLDQMRKNIRKHKRSASPDKIPPRSKKPEQYLKGNK